MEVLLALLQDQSFRTKHSVEPKEEGSCQSQAASAKLTSAFLLIVISAVLVFLEGKKTHTQSTKEDSSTVSVLRKSNVQNWACLLDMGILKRISACKDDQFPFPLLLLGHGEKGS